ncbi:hypothetical protein V8C43DRAFT_288693 [Trichoderma afarasin]
MGRISALICCCFPPLCLSEDEIVLVGAITRIVASHRAHRFSHPDLEIIDYRLVDRQPLHWLHLLDIYTTPIRPTLQYNGFDIFKCLLLVRVIMGLASSIIVCLHVFCGLQHVLAGSISYVTHRRWISTYTPSHLHKAVN